MKFVRLLAYLLLVVFILGFTETSFQSLFLKNTTVLGNQPSLPLKGTNQALEDAAATNESSGPLANNESHSVQSDKAQIVERIMTTQDIETLKKEIGTYDGKQSNSTVLVGDHGTGWRPPTEEGWQLFSTNAFLVEKIARQDATQYLTAVDHTADEWFPPIGNQGSQGSCTAWALGYYVKTFQEAIEHDWDLSGAGENFPPPEQYQDRIMSPAFVYNLINGGTDGGSWPANAIGLMCCVGACSWEKMPYNSGDSTSWPTEDAWKEAPLYRGKSSGYHCLYIYTDDDLTSLKNWIASGNLAVTTIDGTKISSGLGSLLTPEDAFTLDNYAPPIARNHEVAIVGYNGSFKYTEQGQTRYGAFKIANSWGIGGFLGWENVPDGCFWISYEVMKQRVQFCEFFEDRIGYEPALVASFKMSHQKRGECDIRVSADSQAKRFNDYVIGGDQPFCSNNILLDITEFTDVMPNPYDQQYVLTVFDIDTSTTGVLQRFAVEYSESDDTPISTINYDYVYAYVTLPRLQTSWRDGKLIHSDNDFVDNKIAMATDNIGYMYVAYEDWYPADGQNAIFLNRSTDDGRTWSHLAQWNWTGHDCHNPSIAIDPYDNNIYVAYELEHSLSDHDIYCCVYTQSGSVSHVRASAGNEDDRFPSITSEYQYGAFNYQCISYEYVHDYNDRDLMFAYTTNHGNSWTWKKIYGGGWFDNNVHTQTSITNAEGYIYIAYRHGADYDSLSQIHLVRSSNYFVSWTQVTNLDGGSTDCHFPNIAASHGGHCVVVAFENDYSANDVDIRYSYSTDNGASWVKGLSLLGTVENEMSPVLTVDGGGSTNSSIGGYFYLACKVGSFIEYVKANHTNLASWSTPTFVSDSWAGKGLALTTRYRSITTEYHPCAVWNDERNNNLYYSTLGEVHDLDTGLTYPSIQQAINSDSTFVGDTIFVESRIYYETVSVNKTLNLIGENAEDTVIDGQSKQRCVNIETNRTVLSNFTLRDAVFGIQVQGCSDATIQNNIVTENTNVGILAAGCSDTIIQNNLVTNDILGIIVDHANSSVISNNLVAYNYRGGIALQDSCNSVLKNNSMIANSHSFGVYGYSLSNYINDIDTSNMIDANRVYYLVNQTDSILNSSTCPNIGYLALVNCTNMLIHGLVFNNNMEGILLAYTDNSSLVDNVLGMNDIGVYLDSSSFNTIGGGSTICNGSSAIWLSNSQNNTLRGTLMLSNTNGIVLQDSTSNSISRNMIENNQCGIQLWNSSGNLLYHNNFLGNIAQVQDGAWSYPQYYTPSMNLWDSGYPSGGNYWSDYNGTDFHCGPHQNETGIDGIGDTTYTVDSDNADNYPLMNPWSQPDVAVTNLTTSKTVIGQGYSGTVNLTLLNQGNKIEALNTSAYANLTVTYSESIMLAMTNQTLSFIWNTTGFAYGNYTINACAEPLLEEIDIADNNFTCVVPVHVGVPGDVSGPTQGVYDGTTNMRDINYMITHFNSKPNSSNWDPNADVNNDGTVNMRDIQIGILNFNQHE